MMEAAAGAAGAAVPVVGVTVLTSPSAASYAAATGSSLAGIGAEAVRLAGLAKRAGLGGVVASAREVELVRQVMGPTAAVVVPGIRRVADPSGDQARVAAPREAIAAGASHLVIGRPVLMAADPAAAWQEFEEETLR